VNPARSAVVPQSMESVPAIGTPGTPPMSHATCAAAGLAKMPAASAAVGNIIISFVENMASSPFG
jgi:hypothetical protein